MRERISSAWRKAWLKGVDPPPGALDLRGHELHALFRPGQLQHILENLAQPVDGLVQLAGGLGVAVGVDVRRGSGAGAEGILGDIYAHDVLP